MKPAITLRARCLYSKAVQFRASHLYNFEFIERFSSYDVYITDDSLFAFRFLGDSTRTLLIEDLSGVVAVFEIVLECTK